MAVGVLVGTLRHAANERVDALVDFGAPPYVPSYSKWENDMKVRLTPDKATQDSGRVRLGESAPVFDKESGFGSQDAKTPPGCNP